MFARYFTQGDWYAFAGAESWPNTLPLIHEQDDRTFIADSKGIEVIFREDLAEFFLEWSQPVTPEQADRFIEKISTWTMEQIEAVFKQR